MTVITGEFEVKLKAVEFLSLLITVFQQFVSHIICNCYAECEGEFLLLHYIVFYVRIDPVYFVSTQLALLGSIGFICWVFWFHTVVNKDDGQS